jgi:creatinine amidohydrolase
MTDRNVRYWHTMTASEAAEIHEQDPVVVLPLAAIEQHGPHLPLSTDLDIGLGLIARAFDYLPPDEPVFVLPPLAVGTSHEHASFAGTLSLPPEQLVDFIRSLGASLAGAGVRRLVLANSHGGNRFAMDAAGLALRGEHGMLVVKASYFRFARPDGTNLPDTEWRHGLHGGAVETAMMLDLRPDLVRIAQIAGFPSLGEELEGTLKRLGPEGEASFSWLASDLNPHGVAGDATLGSAALGERLVAHYGKALAEVILDTRAFPMDRLGEADGPS